MRKHPRSLHRVSDADELLQPLCALSHPLQNPDDLDPLLDQIGDARFVLLGEASHGTAEYYTWRAAISQRLIREKGFSFIGVEGDWPDCYRINRHVKGMEEDGADAREALHVFRRWPTWMWANEEIVTLTEWLRQHNEDLPEDRKVGFYGLDVYSLWESLYAIMTYLQRVDPNGLQAAWKAFRCFEPHGEDVQEYARATAFVNNACKDEVVNLLRQLRARAPEYRSLDREAYFEAEQNALVLKNAEHYYRIMVEGGPESWNLRDRHMAMTLDRLMRHHGPEAKAIVWEHNTHIGDARYTDMARDNMVNVGQLVRERHADKGVVLVGFSSYQGSVIAGKAWDAPMQRLEVPPAQEGSWDELLHRASPANQLLLFSEGQVPEVLNEERGQRAIGVVYHPEYERYGNYVPTVLPRRYDALLHLDETQALHPLHIEAQLEGEVAETFPSGL